MSEPVTVAMSPRLGSGTKMLTREFRELATLRDGSPVWIRLIRATDKAAMAEGFRHLSERSRQLRFLESRGPLTEAELRYFTELDREHHCAIVCLRAKGLDEGDGLGVARFIELPDAPGVAEIAITVVDEAQGLGVGSLLCARLAQAARERGIRTLRALTHASNSAMKALMRKLDPTAVVRSSGAELVLDARLSTSSRY